jgi:hypothetical protein
LIAAEFTVATADATRADAAAGTSRTPETVDATAVATRRASLPRLRRPRSATGDADGDTAETETGLVEPGSLTVSAAAEPVPRSIAAPTPASTAEEQTNVRDEPMMKTLPLVFQQILHEDSGE